MRCVKLTSPAPSSPHEAPVLGCSGRAPLVVVEHAHGSSGAAALGHAIVGVRAVLGLQEEAVGTRADRGAQRTRQNARDQHADELGVEAERLHAAVRPLLVREQHGLAQQVALDRRRHGNERGQQVQLETPSDVARSRQRARKAVPVQVSLEQPRRVQRAGCEQHDTTAAHRAVGEAHAADAGRGRAGRQELGDLGARLERDARH
jgi:hypothetical protein